MIRYLFLGLTACAVPLSFVAAPYPNELWLQHIPTVVGLILLTLWLQTSPMSRLSFGCCLAFLWFHIIGARWIYSFVPYDQWAEAIFGSTASDAFGWQRNHYDRFVHFASGLLGVAPASELLQRLAGMKPRGAAVMGVASMLAIGALYEVLEWQIAITFSPQQAEAYNGQQGDVWDPQKDLALACLGGVMAAALAWRWKPGDG